MVYSPKKSNEKIAKVLTYLLDLHHLNSPDSTQLYFDFDKVVSETGIRSPKVNNILHNLKHKGLVLDIDVEMIEYGDSTDRFGLKLATSFREKAQNYLLELSGKQREKKRIPEETFKREVALKCDRLTIMSDGLFYFDDKVLVLDNRHKNMLELFMQRPNELVNVDDLKDVAIDAEKRHRVKKDIISKYVSALHKKLQEHYGKPVIENERGVGWIFNPNSN